MSGGALAAMHHMITSTKQIKSSVPNCLKGTDGAQRKCGTIGSRGAAGAGGETGPVGGEGEEGRQRRAHKQRMEGEERKEGSPERTEFNELPVGQSEDGYSGFAGEGTLVEVPDRGSECIPISFPIPLEEGSNEEAVVQLVGEGERETEAIWNPGTMARACRGTVEEPRARTGDLCVYVQNGRKLVGSSPLIARSTEPWDII
jgi:hypothetical protein